MSVNANGERRTIPPAITSVFPSLNFPPGITRQQIDKKSGKINSTRSMRANRYFTLIAGVLLAHPISPLRAAESVDFQKQIKPLLESSCLSCHGAQKPKGKLSLVTRAGALKGGDKGPALVPAKPRESPLYTATILTADHDDLMPPANKSSPLP